MNNAKMTNATEIETLDELLKHIYANTEEKPGFSKRALKCLRVYIGPCAFNVGSTVAMLILTKNPTWLAVAGPIFEKPLLELGIIRKVQKEYKYNLARGMQKPLAKYLRKRQFIEDNVNIMGLDFFGHDPLHVVMTRYLLLTTAQDKDISPWHAAACSFFGFWGAASLIAAGSSILGSTFAKAREKIYRVLDYRKVVNEQHETTERKFQIEPRIYARSLEKAEGFVDATILVAGNRGFKTVDSYKENQVDHYYDTNDRKLHRKRGCVKIREAVRPQSGDCAVKIYFDSHTKSLGDYRTRERERCEIQPQYLEQIMQEDTFKPEYRNEELAQFFSQDFIQSTGADALHEVLRVNNTKKVISLSNNDIKFDVVLDQFNFQDPATGTTKGPYFGSEIKLMKGKYNDIGFLDMLYGLIKQKDIPKDGKWHNDFRTSAMTKYALGLGLLGLCD